MSSPSTSSPRKRKLFRAAAVVAGLLALYAALGFLVAPHVLRRVLVKQASEALHRDVVVERVRVNPFALSVTVNGLTVKHRDGSPFVAWDSFYLRAAPLRIFKWDVGLAEIRLVRPVVHVGLDGKGNLTFQDLIDKGGSSTAEPPAEKKKDGGLGLSIGRLIVQEARVAFRDDARRPAFQTALGPLTFQLESFRTKGDRESAYSFTGTTNAGETFQWAGTIQTQPLRSSGKLVFEKIALPRYAQYVQDALPIDLRDGRVDIDTRYELEMGPERRVIRIAGGKVTVEKLAMGPRGAADAPVALPRIEASGIEVDVIGRDAKVGDVAVKGGVVRVRREADGSLDLAGMAPESSPKSSPEPSEPWKWSVGKAIVSGLTVNWEDRTLPRPAVLALTEVALQVEKLSSEGTSSSPASLSLVWNGRGRLAVNGLVEPLGLRGTVNVEASALDLAPLEPYLEPHLTTRLGGGTAGVKAKIGIDASGAELRWTFAGDVRVDGLSVAERGNDELLRWRALEITGVDAASTPPHLYVRLVRLVEPRVKVHVWEDGTSSLARALRPAPPAAEETRPAVASRSEWRLRFGTVQVARGRVAFVDLSVKPSALVNVTGAEAKVTGLSSDRTVRSVVDVRLQVEGSSPVRISGTVNPFRRDAYTELKVTSEGVDLAPLDPYSGKFLGYGLQKGKLDLDLSYKVENRGLSAANLVKVNQLTLGEATNSPDATKIPVKLALALLKDTNGVISLDVPIEGNLDDPEFRLGKVIWSTVLNVLVKVATSPFRLLSSLAGGGDADLSTVSFAPGTAEPLGADKDRFAMLAKSLAQRPAVNLELEGSTDPEKDGLALRKVELERSLRRAKAATLRSPPSSIDEVTLSPEERSKFARSLFEAGAKAEEKSGSSAPPANQQELEDRLLARIEIAPNAYRALAAERAQRARAELVAAGLDQNRLFLSQGGERAGKEKGPSVYFTVR